MSTQGINVVKVMSIEVNYNLRLTDLADTMIERPEIHPLCCSCSACSSAPSDGYYFTEDEDYLAEKQFNSDVNSLLFFGLGNSHEPRKKEGTHNIKVVVFDGCENMSEDSVRELHMSDEWQIRPLYRIEAMTLVAKYAEFMSQFKNSSCVINDEEQSIRDLLNECGFIPGTRHPSEKKFGSRYLVAVRK